jgi:hypothetical protein
MDINKEEFYECFTEFTRDIAFVVIINAFIFLTDQKKLDPKQAKKVLNEGDKTLYNKVIELMNTFWENYHENRDEKLNEKMNAIKKFGMLKHNSCLFKFILNNICSYISGFLYNNKIYEGSDDLNLESFKQYLVIIIQKMDVEFKQQFLNQKLKSCSDNCEIFKYKKGEKFVNIK